MVAGLEVHDLAQLITALPLSSDRRSRHQAAAVIGFADQAADSRAFGAAAYGFHNLQVAKAIVLQVPNRDASLIPHGTRRPN